MRSLFAGFLLFGLAAQEPAPKPPPNVLVLFADDLGWGDLGVQGGTQIPTPRIDAIAKAGVRCTNGYVTCPVCAPTRAALLSGRYQQRFGFEFNPGPERAAAENFGLPRDVPTLAERLRAAGYATGMVGKWHLGYRQGLRPTERGFDEFFGFLAGARGYLPGTGGAAPILRGVEPVEEQDYLTAAFAREAVAFVEKHHEHPFFLYVAFNAVHTPLHADPSNAERVASIRNERRRTYASMLVAMDDAVGRILDALHARGLDERTLVFFLSDNGGPTPTNTSRNGPLRGNKGQVWEGGIRVPFFVRWTGKLPEGRVEDRAISTLDIVPTVLAAARVAVPAEDALEGVDLLPFLGGARDGAVHEQLCWRFGAQSAIRVGDWKLVRVPDAEPQLFDLSRDLGEERDLAADQPERVAELQAAWEAWNERNGVPRWRRGGR